MQHILRDLNQPLFGLWEASFLWFFYEELNSLDLEVVGSVWKCLLWPKKGPFKSYNKSSLSLLIIEARNLGQCSKFAQNELPYQVFNNCEHEMPKLWPLKLFKWVPLNLFFRSCISELVLKILPVFHLWPDEKDIANCKQLWTKNLELIVADVFPKGCRKPNNNIGVYKISTL